MQFSIDQADELLRTILNRLSEHALPPNKVGNDPMTGQLVRKGYLLDRYVSFKTESDQSVNLAIRQASADDEPYVVVRRRQKGEGSTKLLPVSADRVDISQFQHAADFYISCVVMITGNYSFEFADSDLGD